MAISRKIYTQSNVEIKSEAATLTGGSAAGQNLYAKPDTVQNATYTLTIPRADVNAFGVKGVVARPKLEAESANIEFSFIPRTGSGTDASADQLEDGTQTPTDHANTAALSEKDMNAMLHDTLANSPDYVGVVVQEVGAIAHSLMTSFSADASVGAMPTFSLSFIGAQAVSGDFGFGAQAGSSETADGGGAASTLSVVEPNDIFATTPTGHGCVQSLAWAWDIPVELVLCLGGNPATDGEALSSPPGTASMTLEGLQEVSDANKLTSSNIGAYQFEIGNGEIDSRTSNMAVGELFATYNYVVGSTADSCNIK
tara:strand:- start:13121 stop:14056 length:936 start_codon:yes stop_codon:yes gene_type:complete